VRSEHFIGGSWVPGDPAAARLAVVDPATGEPLTEIPAGGAAEADAAVAAARKAATAWAATPATERAAVLRRLADAVEDAAEDLAALQTADNGKPLPMSRGDVAGAAGTLRQYAELGPLHRGRALVGNWEATDVMVAEPYGVAAVIVPWNDPLGIAAGLLGATLVTGNTVVLKPSERAPLALIRLVELLDAPPGVCNLLLGDGRAGAALVGHPDVDLVCHVGSLATGREIAERCGRLLRKCVLELGGKDPLVIDAGVDPGWAADQAAQGAFANAGQICTSVERIYVHRDVAGAFLDALVTRAEAFEIGPLIDQRHREHVAGHVDAAVAAGARLLTGGHVPDGPGSFYPPTVLVDVPEAAAVLTEETFGPVAAVRVVEGFADGLRQADAGEYGLAASVLTGSQAHAQEAWRVLRAGTVKVNNVWGGAPGGAAEPHKRSGLGFGYGPELLDEVTTTKVVHYEPAPPP
jgi:succinate-semialdehyde dehydrogenase/glutarate-semialdehyde dehydrogenase